MKQVVTVNLGGNAYQLDADGYAELGRYLDDARARLAGNPDIEEIMADLELAIADKASRFLGPGKSVVSGSEVDRILGEMGPVDMPPGAEASDRRADGSDASRTADGNHGADGAHAHERERTDEGARATGTADAAGSGQAAGSRDTGGRERASPAATRKLYRLTEPDDKMIAGICAGLAAYLGTDVSILRILLIVLVFVSAGTALVAYLLLILIIPAAKTPEERAAAFGAPFDAQDVLERVRSKFSGSGEQREARFRQGARTSHRGPEWRGARHDVFRWVLASIVIGLGIVVALWLATGMFRMMGLSPAPWGPMYFGVPYWGPSWLMLIVIALVLALILSVLGVSARNGSSFVGSFLVVFAILCLIWFASHAFGAAHWIADGAQHFLPRWMG